MTHPPQAEKKPPVRIVVLGAGGRMGRALLTSARADEAVVIAAAVDHDEAPCLGDRIEGVEIGPVSALALTSQEVVIDFTAPAASLSTCAMARRAGAAYVLGTTGFSGAELAQIDAAGCDIAIVRSGNMSLGVNLLAAVVKKAAAVLPAQYDIEIVEAHHNRKVDAPSGTALMLGRAAAAGRGAALDAVKAPGRCGATAPRKAGDIGFAVIRGGGVVGDHDVHFMAGKEALTLSHRALDRTLFADGALAAAKWVFARAPGIYSMADVLGID